MSASNPSEGEEGIKPSSVLSTVEQEHFARLEATVERGLTGFVEVGRALTEIREQRLYRATYPTFEAYCQERWGVDRRNANRTIEAVAVANALGSVDPAATVANVRQARELAPLVERPAEMRAALEEASAEGKPTARKIRAAVSRITGREPASAPESPPEEPASAFELLGRAVKLLAEARAASQGLEGKEAEKVARLAQGVIDVARGIKSDLTPSSQAAASVPVARQAASVPVSDATSAAKAAIARLAPPPKCPADNSRIHYSGVFCKGCGTVPK